MLLCATCIMLGLRALTSKVWRYQRGNQNPYIEEEQTTQWPKEEEQTTQWPKEEEQTTQWPREEEQKNKQGSTNQTHKTKALVTRTLLKIAGEFRCYGRVSSSCSTNEHPSC